VHQVHAHERGQLHHLHTSTGLRQRSLDIRLEPVGGDVLLAVDGVQQLVTEHAQLLQLADQLHHVALGQLGRRLGLLRGLQRAQQVRDRVHCCAAQLQGRCVVVWRWANVSTVARAGASAPISQK
jgi:hypothetical protein